MYTIMGLFPVLRREMNKEFKRLGFKNIKEKRWLFNKVLGYPAIINEMTISELETVICELKKYNNISEIG
ncbi:hypothetical protein ABEV41_00800 [Geobacillus thermodenitrificans]|uniref:hypothetical protein n=1 Tax=Geobacillus thermodenitrificans TaxID=33940 RepID=UPI003D24EBF4